MGQANSKLPRKFFSPSSQGFIDASKSSSRGFTLIELLVVISIISLLASIALPAFVHAREKGRDQRRTLDYRQMVIALSLYYSDKGHYPCEYGFSSDSNLFLKELVDNGYIGGPPHDPINSPPLIYQYSSYKNTPDLAGQCGQIFELDMNKENANFQCPLGSIEVNPGHCHLFYPTPLPCSNPYLTPPDFGLPYVEPTDCTDLRDQYHYS